MTGTQPRLMPAGSRREIITSRNYRALPILINARDLLTPLKRLIDWLVEGGYPSMYVLDSDASSPPLLEYYERIRNVVTVVPLGCKVGHTSLWDMKVLERLKIE